MAAKRETTGTCALCLEAKKLCESHIVPDYCYKFVKTDRAEGHPKLLRMTFGENPARVEIKQTGAWHYLLCEDCDTGRIGKLDAYFASVWSPGLFPGPVHEQVVTVPGLDYSLFKRFHLSVLWRAAVSKRLGPTELGPHAERIRQMLWNEDPGTFEEYSLAGVLMLEDDSSVNWQQVSPPVPVRSGVYLFWYCGVAWLFRVTNSWVPGFEGAFRPGMDLSLLTHKWKEMSVFKRLAVKLGREGLFEREKGRK